MKTKNLIEKQQKPQSSGKITSSHKLWIVELIHRLRNELGLECGEVLQEERRQETIFTEREQVLLVKRIYVAFGVLIDDTVGDDNRPALICGTDTVERETPRKTRH